MRRVLLLLAIAAMLVAMLAEAGPAGAAAPAPTSDPPGKAAETIPADSVGNTKPAGKNCNGQVSSNHVKGSGGDPGGLAVPTEFPAGTPNFTGHAVSTLDPVSQISDFQTGTAEKPGVDAAGTSCDLSSG